LTTVRPTKPIFNLFLKLSHIAHTHLNGNVYIIDHDYEAQLNENFIPFFKFVDHLVRFSFKNDLLNREIINLLIISAQQALLLNINCVPFIIEQINHIISSKGPSGASSESVIVIFNETIRKYVLESPYLIGFIQTILFDYRHALSKRDIYEFMQSVFTCEFLLSKIDIQKVLEEIIKSIKDLKEAFEVFVNPILLNEGYLLQKQSTLQLQQYEFKISVLFGNTVIVYFILSLCSLNEGVKSHLKNLIMQIHDYFRDKVIEIKILLTTFEQKQQQEQQEGKNSGDETTKTIDDNDQQSKKPKYEEHPSISNLQQKFFESLLQKLVPILQYMTNSINISTSPSTSATPNQQISDLQTDNKK
jgi:hypothetical protein